MHPTGRAYYKVNIAVLCHWHRYNIGKLIKINSVAENKLVKWLSGCQILFNLVNKSVSRLINL